MHHSTRLDNYLKTYRKKTGLSQREVAFLLGCENPTQITRYEKRRRMPPLPVVLAYEAMFRVPAAELFAGLRDTADANLQIRINKLTQELEERQRSGNTSRDVARKIEWIREYRTATSHLKNETDPRA